MKNTKFIKIVSLFSFIIVLSLLFNCTSFAFNNVAQKNSDDIVLEYPSDYTGQTSFGEVSGTLTWAKNQVSSFNTADKIYTYEYNANGYRTIKKIVSKDAPANYWIINYIWNSNQVEYFNFINNHGQSMNVSALFNENGKTIGFTCNNSTYFFNVHEETITGLNNLENETIVEFQYIQNQPMVFTNSTSFDDEFLILAVLTIPAVIDSTILDYESGIETTIKSSSALIVKAPVHKQTSQARTASYQIIVYRYKNKGITVNPFGHLDIRFNQYSKHYSYANYDGGANFLIITDSTAYLNHQSNYQTYETSNLWISNNAFHAIYGFYNFPLQFKYDSGNFAGKYWKITSGPYMTYNLATKNCATIVRDALAKGYGTNVLNNYSSNWSNLSTPNAVFGMARYLQGVWV